MEMDKVIGLIEPLVKEGADLTPVKEALGTMDPLAKVTDKDSAWGFIKSNDLLLSVLDQKTTERIKDAKGRWTETDLTEALKAREAEIRAEINPKETPEQKQLRELKAQLDQRDAKEALRALQDSLSEKAKELNFDPMKARDYAVYGESAVEKLTADAEWFNTTVEEKVNALAKEKYSSTVPKVKVPSNGLSSLSDNDLMKLATTNPDMKSAVLSEVATRNSKLKR